MKAETQKVKIGGMSEASYGTATLERFRQEHLGDYTVLFAGPWSAEKIRKIGDFCRKENMRFVMDEIVSRLTGRIRTSYQGTEKEVIAVLDEYRDVLDGSLLMCEYGGLMFYWPYSTVQCSTTRPPDAANVEDAAQNTESQMIKTMEYARSIGMKPPFICIEACGAASPFIFRAGIDRVDLEVIYTPELERSFSALKGACLAFGKPRFGVDMAMVWYGGNQHDSLWEKRWRTSLFHAFLRGADPIYAEHGIMDYKALGKNYGTDHPDVKRFRKPLAELAEYAEKHHRPAGFPEAAVAIVQGRYDGFAGNGQTHLWGQRQNEDFRIGIPDCSWELFERLYRRRTWENRERFGEADYSGNPPLGQADIIPFDAPDEIFTKYKALIFLGRNCMDSELYNKLIRYVKNGGQLLMTAAHLNQAPSTKGDFEPFGGGDWRELFGVRLKNRNYSRLPYGIKFKAEPPCGWKFPLWSPDCDPKYTDGGFAAAELETAGAEILAVSSGRFADIEWKEEMSGILFANKLGKGCAVLLDSLEYPGAGGVKNLYGFLMESCCEAVDIYPKVECSDRVRYAVYPDGKNKRIYFLNTEENLPQYVIFHFTEDRETSFVLAPGEFREEIMD